jgi:hypothetical protein
MKRFCVLFAILAVASAAPAESDGLVATALRFVKDCGDKSMVLCMKVSKTEPNATTKDNRRIQIKTHQVQVK